MAVVIGAEGKPDVQRVYCGEHATTVEKTPAQAVEIDRADNNVAAE